MIATDGDSRNATVPLFLAFFVVDLLKRLVIKIWQTRNIKNLSLVQNSLRVWPAYGSQMIKQSKNTNKPLTDPWLNSVRFVNNKSSEILVQRSVAVFQRSKNDFSRISSAEEKISWYLPLSTPSKLVSESYVAVKPIKSALNIWSCTILLSGKTITHAGLFDMVHIFFTQLGDKTLSKAVWKNCQ